MSDLFADVKVGDVVELSNGKMLIVTSVSKKRFKCGDLAFWKYRGMIFPYKPYAFDYLRAIRITALSPLELKGE